MVTTDELTAMKDVQAGVLPETVVRWRDVQADDGSGGFTTTSGSVSLAGRIGAVGGSPQERAIAERLGSVTPYVITVAAGADVENTDRLAVGSRTFEVKGVVKGSYETARRCVCVEVI